MPGSGQSINYQIRPSKSVERKMLCELIRQIQLVRNATEFRYIGLGAKYFSDFILFHNEFGITDMISIESEVECSVRFDFNKPLGWIKMKYGTTNMVLPQIEEFEQKMNVVWLDFDGVFEESMIQDIETLCRNLSVGSLFFISCNYSYRGDKPSEKREDFKRYVGDYFIESIENNKYSSKRMPLVIRQIINENIQRVLEKRNRVNQGNIQYKQLLFFTYKDGAPMMTIGGILVDDLLENEIDESDIIRKFDYCRSDEEFYVIDIPPLTYKEIQLVLQNIPITEGDYKQREKDFFGISYEEIKKFEKIYRYYPYYTEGRLNT